MSGWLNRWFSPKKSSRDSGFDFVSQDFPRVSVAEVSKELELERLAREYGSHELPREGETQPDSPHEMIHQWISSHQAKATTGFQNEMAPINQRVADIDMEERMSTAQNLPSELSQKLSLVLQRSQDVVEADYKAYRKVDSDLRSFKAEHGITRAANFPRSYNEVYAKLATIVLGQAVVNAWFFAQGSDHGFLGGAVQALVFGLIDIVISFNVGRALPWMFSGRRVYAACAGLAAVFLVAWIPAFNLGVAHYRDAMLSDPDSAEWVAVQTFSSSPFGISDLMTWVLFVFGFLLSISAVVSGYNSDDPAPGYGELERRTRERERAYRANREKVTKAGHEKLKEYQDKLDEIISEVRVDLDAFENAIQTKETLLANVPVFFEQFEKIGNALIREYRDENLKVRTTPAPAYFQTEWVPKVPPELKESTDEERARLRSLRESAANLRSSRTQLAKELATEHEAFNAKLKDAEQKMASAWPAGLPTT
jgi:hypothetical protein